ncbi:MAG: copper amine oxidase N-terminal domain-containing protein [Oscillospiraceae bacterium]|nr:copper amine oxidase N-terminal domain-containing protein [Oscillospiraceae bacterium]
MCGVTTLAIPSATAITTDQNAYLSYRDIKICIDGQFITPKDVNGNVVEPFIYNGTTYLPVRAVGEALGKSVEFDSSTYTVYLGAKPVGGATDGTRSNPFSGSTGATVSYNEYSFEPTRQVKVKTLKTITGEAANYLATTENPYNTVTGSQEWVFFEIELGYLSSTGGEDDVLSASDIIYNDTFYTPDGSVLPVADRATLGDIYSGSDVFDVKLYPNGSSKVVIGLLTNKGYDKILLKVPCEGGDKNSWILVNDSADSISTVAELKTYLGLGENNTHENDPVKITLNNSLPETISSYSGDTREASALITDFSYTVNGSNVKLTFTGEKTYDEEGSGQSRQVKVGWKLYDSEGYVVEDGTAYSTSIKVGEKFKNCEDSIYGLEPGEYTLEIMGVN